MEGRGWGEFAGRLKGSGRGPSESEEKGWERRWAVESGENWEEREKGGVWTRAGRRPRGAGRPKRLDRALARHYRDEALSYTTTWKDAKMPIPDYQTLMLPLLRLVSNTKVWTIRELTQALSDEFRLTEEERQQLLPSGQQTLMHNRVSWAKTYLKNAGLIAQPSRGKVVISDLGRSVLDEKPQRIDYNFLMRFDSFRDFRDRSVPTDPEETQVLAASATDARTPLELIDSSFQTLIQAVVDDLLSRLKTCSPAFFERTVVKLLVAMGYGGLAGEEAGAAIGRPGDGGIDGVINQDKLGLDVVCLQAKRWEGPVGRPVVQQFVGSMDYIRAKKGVILTTSTFTADARLFVDRIEAKKVVLIDGQQLARLMMEHNLGVTIAKTYELKEVSNDFFEDDEG